MKILVTGGAGFIGSAVCRYYINNTDVEVVNVDKLTYAANLASLAEVSDNPRYAFAIALEHGGGGAEAAGPVGRQVLGRMVELGLFE